ncbi:MAG: hypothetical protein DWQ46_00400 [Planctomycetota bacterium]|nr:MAG: hypothetical protein DWQ46_00400 [Planctomycetota bacterium]
MCISASTRFTSTRPCPRPTMLSRRYVAPWKSSGMPQISVRIPQLGEGLQEALLVEFLKQPGDTVRRDEPLYTMETDKAVTEVESPYDGTLIEWTAEVSSVQAVGAEIARMEVAEGVEEMAAGHGPPTPAAATSPSAPAAAATSGAAPSPPAKSASPARGRGIPPRTRKYLREKGLLDVADQIPSKSNKLMPEDVDAFLAAGGTAAAAATEAAATATETDAYTEAPLPTTQQTLNFRLVRGAQVCVPVTISAEVDWSAIEQGRATVKANQGDAGPSALSMLLWCVARAMEQHDKFRSTLSADGKTLRTYQHASLGIAVALPGDLLVTAVIEDADAVAWPEFAARVAERIEAARGGTDQATAATTLSVTNMGSVGIRSGVAAIVAPAVATLTLGETYLAPQVDQQTGEMTTRRMAMLTLSFDHRVINGVGAAEFLNEIRSQVESFELPA